MDQLAVLLEQLEATEREIEALRKSERVTVLKQVRLLCREHRFTAGMLEKYLAVGRVRRTGAEMEVTG